MARGIVERILSEKRLLSNRRVLVIAVGGWTQVLRFASDMIRANLALRTCKIIIVLDRDIKASVPGFIKKEHIGFPVTPNYLPVQSLEKYLLNNLIVDVDHNLFRELNDYLFQGKSLDEIVKVYCKNVKNGIISDEERIKSGKAFHDILNHELKHIRKNDYMLIELIIDYLFRSNNPEITELSTFLENELQSMHCGNR